MNNHCVRTVHYIRHHRLAAYPSIPPPHPAAVPLLLIHQCLLLSPLLARIPGSYSSSTGSWCLKVFCWSESIWRDLNVRQEMQRCDLLPSMRGHVRGKMSVSARLASYWAAADEPPGAGPSLQGIPTLLIRLQMFQVMVSCPSLYSTVTQRLTPRIVWAYMPRSLYFVLVQRRLSIPELLHNGK